MEFTYDPVKAANNLKKHGVSFAEAIDVFNHAYIEEEDERHVYGEQCFKVTGWSGVRMLVLTVIYTPREGRIRLISARRASRTERRIYYETFR